MPLLPLLPTLWLEWVQSRKLMRGQSWRTRRGGHVTDDSCDDSCNGPIVNFFAFTNYGCNNDGTPSETFSPFFYQTKLTEDTSTNKPFYDGTCEQIKLPNDGSTNDGSFYSFVYTNDGADKDRCYLTLHDDEECTGGQSSNLPLKNDVSACINNYNNYRYVKLFCLDVRIRILAATTDPLIPLLTSYAGHPGDDHYHYHDSCHYNDSQQLHNQCCY